MARLSSSGKLLHSQLASQSRSGDENKAAVLSVHRRRLYKRHWRVGRVNSPESD